jgi:hypothetical protein
MPFGVESRRQRPDRPAGASAVAAGVPWGAAGFVLGALFWIGLGTLSWDDGAVSWQFPSLEPHSTGCTSLAIDRRTGDTTAEPCRNSVPLPEVIASARSELAAP